MKQKLSAILLTLSLNASNYAHYEPSKMAQKFFNNCDVILDKFYYQNCYDYSKKSSLAVAYKLDKNILEAGHIKNRPKFEPDYKLAKKYRTDWNDYLHSGYDRGHILSNQSMNATTDAQRSTFLMSNIVPQTPELNRNVWLKAEKRERQVALAKGWAEVINLIEFDENNKRYIKNGIRVPTSFVKIILSDGFQECFRMPNIEFFENDRLKTYRIDCGEFNG